MVQQLSFDGFDSYPAKRHNLFFALRPDRVAAALIMQRTKLLSRVHRLSGKPTAADRLHVSLYSIWDYIDEPPARISAKAIDIAAQITAASFTVTFDRAMSFRNNRGWHLVLCGSEGVRTLAAFQTTVSSTMRKAGIGAGPNPRFEPHVTLIYGANRAIDEQPIEPISWTATDFVLIDSLVGQGRHIALGRWPLRG